MGRMRSHFLKGAAIVAAALMLVPSAALAAVPQPYFNGFETGTQGWISWYGGTITQVASGSVTTGYAQGISAADGSSYATVNSTVGECVSTATECSGPYTQWGGYSSTFPPGGYTTSIKIYLDVSWAKDHTGLQFDWDSAINNSGGSFERDYIFSNLTTSSGFEISVDSSSPENPANTGMPMATVTQSGWYTYVHHFYAGKNGLLDVDMTLVGPTGSVIESWTLVSGDKMSDTGGNRYGWFPTLGIPNLPIDDSTLTTVTGPVYQPLAYLDMTSPVTDQNPTPTIITSPTGTVGQPFFVVLHSTGGVGFGVWSLKGGSVLPPGLSLNPSGAITGTPTTAGTYTFTIQVTDLTMTTVTQPITITINPAS